ncbi:Nse1 non-SMC component of SMC5-6 complex-domain-containing protein [Boeremia exigua]|uniref:Nse1 non-SMC component of SMC5-6 complex-domain-containing protein n=1 Tax=Boeremia exigua TaxID=749465 RepID=UPI001E8CD811|nr:Nse1 non-SMC component of SMC5-6 complex-domain-containing protein [Boeremia exigua]KAH6616821.1 Nse1 non-SMC component of SMC5-6 complex-domain-containing protein [Boeremia exigua]
MSRDETPLVRDVPDEEAYTHVHRVFLQSFFTHGVMTVDEIKPVLAAIMTAHNPERPFPVGDVTQSGFITPTIQTINARLEPYNFEIRHTRNQQTKETTYALVNKTSDAMTQLATRFSPSEIAFIRRLLDAMFDTNNTPTRETMAVKQMEASQLARPRRSRQSQAASLADDAQSQADAGISIAEADAVLDALVADRFLQLSRAMYFSLAPRALMELHSYLKETYNEGAEDEDEEPVVRIRDCEGCREIVTFGIRCNNRECGVRWHDRCANQYYRGKSAEGKRCPKCRAVCSGNVYVGERADRVPQRNSAGGRGGDEEMEEDEEDE